MNPHLLKIVRNNHQVLKYQQLEDLAATVTDGVIVELGTHLGYGAIALCTGATVPVYTVDDYQNRQGWAGEYYYPNDFEIARKNCLEANIGLNSRLFLIRCDVRQAALLAHTTIELLFWDLGIPARLCEDFEAWQSHITGKFVVHDTEDNRLGSDLLNPAGWTKKKDGVFWVLERDLSTSPLT